jgi:hypothetical protein
VVTVLTIKKNQINKLIHQYNGTYAKKNGFYDEIKAIPPERLEELKDAFDSFDLVIMQLVFL